MDKKLLGRLELVFKQVFDDKSLILNVNDTPNTINSWDSLIQVNLIAAIEIEFNIKIDFFEMIELDCVKNILAIIKTKIDN